MLAVQIFWSENMETGLNAAMNKGGDIGPVEDVLKLVENTLNVLADSVLYEQPPVRRKKLESLVSMQSSVNEKFLKKSKFERLKIF